MFSWDYSQFDTMFHFRLAPNQVEVAVGQTVLGKPEALLRVYNIFINDSPQGTNNTVALLGVSYKLIKK